MKKRLSCRVLLKLPDTVWIIQEPSNTLSCSRRLKFPLPKWSFNRKLLWRPPTEKLVGVKGRTRTSTDQGGLLLPAAAVTLGGLWNLGWTCWELASFPFMSSISLFLCSFYLTIFVPLPYIREEGALSTTEEEVVFDIALLSTHLTKWHSCLFTMSLPLTAENVELLNLRENAVYRMRLVFSQPCAKNVHMAM